MIFLQVVIGASIFDFVAKFTASEIKVRALNHKLSCATLVLCHVMSCDVSCDVSCDPQSEGTNPGSLHQVSGGVARNIAGNRGVNVRDNRVNFMCVERVNFVLIRMYVSIGDDSFLHLCIG